MNQSTQDRAEGYYTALANKDLAAMERYLHPEVQFNSPLKKLTGREAFFKDVREFLPIFTRLTIQTSVADGDQAVVIYEIECPEPFGKTRSAGFLRFKEGLITAIELFFDARPFA